MSPRGEGSAHVVQRSRMPGCGGKADGFEGCLIVSWHSDAPCVMNVEFKLSGRVTERCSATLQLKGLPFVGSYTEPLACQKSKQVNGL